MNIETARPGTPPYVESVSVRSATRPVSRGDILITVLHTGVQAFPVSMPRRRQHHNLINQLGLQSAVGAQKVKTIVTQAREGGMIYGTELDVGGLICTLDIAYEQTL